MEKNSNNVIAKSIAIRLAKNLDDLENGYIIMEDLSINGEMMRIADGLSKLQVENVLKKLAQFHAFSLELPANVFQELDFPESQFSQVFWKYIKDV